MQRRLPPSPKRYLIRTAKALQRLRSIGEEQWYDDFTLLDELVIVLEDRRFLGHRGLDWRSAAREIFRAVTFRRHGGASTIEMQFVRTVTGRYDRTLRRKAQEIALSFLVDYHLSKPKILHGYLSVAYFGTGIWGLDSAKEQIFGKQPWEDLNLEEASMLAAMLVYPRPRVPTENWQRKVDRRAKYGRHLHARLEKSLKEAAI